MNPSRLGDGLSALILLLASLLGLGAFLLPFLSPPSPEALGDPTGAHAQDAPLILLALLGLCFLVIVANLETRRMDARLVALLGVLVAINASLRLISGPLGASAMFLLPILCGYVLGADFGFLLASLSVFASAILTGGVGPWLPFQMFASGWCGMVAGWLPQLRHRGLAVAQLAAWGAVSGFLFGFVFNLWFWPFLIAQNPDQSWQPGLGLLETAVRYSAYYLASSSWWDAGRAVGNVVLITVLGAPVLRLLERFQARFRFRVED